jgi:hypothetical protein
LNEWGGFDTVNTRLLHLLGVSSKGEYSDMEIDFKGKTASGMMNGENIGRGRRARGEAQLGGAIPNLIRLDKIRDTRNADIILASH